MLTFLALIMIFYIYCRGDKGKDKADKQMLAALVLGAGLGLYVLYQSQFKEITLKEFFQTYLSSGRVSFPCVLLNDTDH